MKNAIKKLDREFSIFIRLRDSQNGVGRCISCGKVVHWKQADCGHFVNRKHLSLRFSEKNCNLQCRACNRFDEGNPVGYARGLIEKYGDGILEELEIAKRQTVKFSKAEIELMIKHYRKLNKNESR